MSEEYCDLDKGWWVNTMLGSLSLSPTKLVYISKLILTGDPPQLPNYYIPK